MKKKDMLEQKSQISILKWLDEQVAEGKELCIKWEGGKK